MRVTAAGRATAEVARVALRAADQAVDLGRRIGRAGAGCIRIVCAEVFGKEGVVVVAAAGHPFADLPAVPFSALAGEPFVHYHQSNGLGIWIDELAARHQIVLNSILRTRSPLPAVQLAAAGRGVAIVPVSALPSHPPGTVRQLHPTMTIEVIAMVAAPSDTLVRQFVDDVHRRGMPADELMMPHELLPSR